MTQFRAALDGGKHRAKIGADKAIADGAGLRSSPSFVINGYVVAGLPSKATFEKIIDRALKEADH